MRKTHLACVVLLALFPALGRSADERVGKSEQQWPLWDGHESVAEYAKKAGLEPTLALDLGNGVKLDLVLIPAGKFTMGTPKPESPEIGGAILSVAGLAALILIAVPLARAVRQRRRPQFSLRWLILLVAVLGVAEYGAFRFWWAAEAGNNYWDSESPAHEVTISTPFYLGRYEVTQGQYDQVIGTNPSSFTGRDLPVRMVSWDDAQDFCKKAGEKTNVIVRLPTEAEWEYACRAGTTTRFCSGDSDSDLEGVAWYDANSSGRTHPVGQKKPNAWGLHDMHGNVWEWVQDFYGPYKSESATDPQGAAQGQYRLLRGGSCDSLPGGCRSTNRIRGNADRRFDVIGFRAVGSLPRTP